MKIQKNKLTVSFIASFSWILACSGIIYYQQDILYFLVILTSLLVCTLAIYITYPNYIFHYKKTQESYSERLIFWLLFFIYTAFIIQAFNIVIQHDFNLQHARNTFFTEEGKSSIFVYPIFSMAYTYLVTGIFWAYLASRVKLTKKHVILIILYVVAGSIIGGRFNLYKILIFFPIHLLLNKQYYKKINILNKYTISLVILGICISLNRQMKINNTDIAESLIYIINGLYEYHSIQFGIYNLFISEHNYFFTGIFTGLLTPIYVILGNTSIEGNIGNILNEIAFTDKSFNAFGTSAVYFSVFQEFGPVLYLWSVIFIFIFSSKIKNPETRKTLYIFNTMSFYFSAFSPYFYTFSWWVSVICVLTLFKKSNHVS
ncbi:TPA: O-antigen polymerase [Providencia stuartii]